MSRIQKFYGVEVLDQADNTTIRLDGDRATISIDIARDEHKGDIIVRDEYGHIIFHLDGRRSSLRVGGSRNDSSIVVVDRHENPAIILDSYGANLYVGCKEQNGTIIVRDSEGKNRIRLDGLKGDISLEGADCAEEFDVVDCSIDPGSVLVLNDESRLEQCTKPYDKRVTGVVSGGNGSNPGIILDKNPTQNKRLPIALNGKVYCKVDAQFASIKIGDLLTTSPTPGHAMKAVDPLKSFGAVIGKALRNLDNGIGVIPILAALQ